MQSVKAKDVVLYVTMPRFVPRFRSLFSSGFAYVAFLMAHIYYMVRLLPQNHPYIKAENIGRFGIRSVVVEAARHLTFSLKNIDQILIFFALLIGIIVIVAQLVVFAYAILIPSAMAFSWFDTPVPANDIAYSLLDRVFGVNNVFCSSFTPTNCTAYSADTNPGLPGAQPMPLPYHLALQGLFTFYSTGLLLIATLIFLYFIVVLLLETVTSGTPFGQRFQNVWAPVRLIVAIGLLLPVSNGLNSGQFIVLYAAKYGSSFATNGWVGYNTAVAGHAMFGGGTPTSANPVGEPQTLLAMPGVPDVAQLVEAMSLVHACAYAYTRLNAGQPNTTSGGVYEPVDIDYTAAGAPGWRPVQLYLVKTPSAGMAAGAIGGTPIIGDPVNRLHIPNDSTVSYLEAMGFYYGSDIVIRFGEYKEDTSGNSVYTDQTGEVKPLCGDVRIPVPDISDAGGAEASPSRGGADRMIKAYYDMVLTMWFNDETFRQFGRSFVVLKTVKNTISALNFCRSGATESTGAGASLNGIGTIGFWAANAPDNSDCQQKLPKADWKVERIRIYKAQLETVMLQAWTDYVNNSVYSRMEADIMARGWGGAGIWYNKLAEINGGWMSGVAGVPAIERYPLVMEQVKSFKMQHSQGLSQDNQFDPTVPAGSENSSAKYVAIEQGQGEVLGVAEPLNEVYQYWRTGRNIAEANAQTVQNILVDGMHMLLGTTGIASLQGANRHLHPMAQLVMVGKGLVDSAIFNMAASSTSAFLGGMLGALGRYESLAGALEAASQVFFSLAFMGLTAGFVLFYVLPFLPFVYFYFAVATWVKAIFEAMVGVPLWALAHLRIDGDGLPGDAAQNGYFLILEIFIRPILTVVGLIAAITIFSAQVRLLSLVWELVIANASGFTVTADIFGTPRSQLMDFARDIVDQFFFTIIYTIVCYMLAMSSFKLIDKIPDNILRWAGAGVSSFGDIDQDNIESLNRYASMGGMTIGNEAASAITSASKGAGGAVGSEIRDFIGGGAAKKAQPNLPT